MGVIQDLRDEKALILFHDYRNNTAVDDSKYEHNMTDLDGTLSNTDWDGRGITFPASNSYISVSHDDLLELDEGCLVVFTDDLFQSQTNTEYLMMHTSGAPDGFIWYLTATTIAILNMGAPISLTTSVLNKKTIAVNFANGSTPEGFLDGVSAGSFSGSATVTKATSGTLGIGNSTAGSYPLQSTLQAALIVNRELTAAEHASLHAELVARFEETRWTDAQARILSQYQDSPNVKALIEVIFNRIDNVDYVLRYLRDYTSLDTACGVWLDVVGDILGIERPHIEQSYGTILSFKPEVDPGTVWEIESSAADNNWYGITHANGLYVTAAASGALNRIMTSPNGVDWTTRTTPNNNDYRDIAYGAGVYCTISSTGALDRAMTSPDGVTWTARVTPNNNNYWGLAYGNGVFVATAVSGVGNRVMSSPDGITWTARISAADSLWYNVAYSEDLNLFAATATDGGVNGIMTSPDGITWTLRTTPNEVWHAITWGGSLFVAVGSAGAVMTSPDGITWTARTADNYNYFGIAYGDGVYSATASGSAVAIVSEDGITWETVVTPAANNWRRMVYADGQFVSVALSGTGNRVMRSSRSMGIDDPYKGWV